MDYKVVMDVKRAGEILLEARQIFKECGVEFFLVCGTCLGAIRENRILLYDGDVDVGVKHEILKERIAFLVKMFMERDFAVEILTSPYNYPRALDVRKDLIHICIYDYDLSGDKRFHAWVERIGTCSIFNKNLFENLKRIEFLGTIFLVPNPPEEFLKAHYGDWRIPDPNDHICKADIENSFDRLVQGKEYA